ncbi:pyrophosphatase [Luteimonas sp. FCS-9]|nr:pyrophosphatase [Luteimonas sp. FCS-9]
MLVAGTGFAGAQPPAAAVDTIRHPFHVAQPDPAAHEALLAVEIPAGGSVKYEIGAEDGLVHVDRFLSMPVAYPANYGSMPATRAGDGDPLDALVLTRAPIHPGALIRFRPLGVLRMRDRGQADEKIVGVPVDDVDPSYAGMRDLSDLPAAERARIEAFFRVYKDLPEGGNGVALHGWGDAAEARRLIGEAIARAAQ